MATTIVQYLDLSFLNVLIIIELHSMQDGEKTEKRKRLLLSLEESNNQKDSCR